jgi:hypothetical protein
MANYTARALRVKCARVEKSQQSFMIFESSQLGRGEHYRIHILSEKESEYSSIIKGFLSQKKCLVMDGKMKSPQAFYSFVVVYEPQSDDSAWRSDYSSYFNDFQQRVQKYLSMKRESLATIAKFQKPFLPHGACSMLQFDMDSVNCVQGRRNPGF